MIISLFSSHLIFAVNFVLQVDQYSAFVAVIRWAADHHVVIAVIVDVSHCQTIAAVCELPRLKRIAQNLTSTISVN